MKKPPPPTISEVQLLMQTQKQAIRMMEWVKKPSPLNPPWQQFECACQILNEVREDVIFRMQYRHLRKEIIGKATINLPAKFNAALFVGPHRVSALDVDTTPHTNKIGQGRPLYGSTFSAPHLHIWTEKGYGYAEPFPLADLELETLYDAFCPLASINPSGTFVHPMTQVNVQLL